MAAGARAAGGGGRGISAKGGVSPPVFPLAVAPLGDVLGDLVTVAPAPDTLGVDVSTVAGRTQLLNDGRQLPLETVMVPHRGWATFLKAGATTLPDGRPLPGPLVRHAWVIEVAIDEAWLRSVYPAEFPLPALWILEGIAFDEENPAVDSVRPVLDAWLAGTVPGVVAQT